ncbi:hypothetical protein [Ktedonospora formicarum]|uniref:Uncharacterized protein n=1 Tax=Ktedonospora formicarum TaxID=2778364 RepID=A0A8J3MQN6_9CHLR|nr:hypothetical protein [Ktedonospora formicarum]GHO42793.1 hypothetical protein KSX_09560 [Ktedonospora formicarum]
MIKFIPNTLLARKQPKQRRWWHHLDLLLIVLFFQVVVLVTQWQPLLQVANSTMATIAQHTELTNTYTGLGAIAVPLGKIISQAHSATPEECQQKNTTDQAIKDCLEGGNNNGTYTKKDPKIQNPIAKENALFFNTPTDITIENANIRSLWGFILGIVDAFLVVVIMLNGVKLILTGGVFRYSRAVEELPGVLVAIIAAHLSLTFAMAIVGLNNTMTNYIYSYAQENPDIHRTKSGFGAGDYKDYTLRLFFPTMDASRKEEFEKQTDVTWQEAAQKWRAPDNAAPNDKGTTSEDVKQFNKDMFCTLKKINFDNQDRIALFDGGDYKGSEIYRNVKDRSENIIKQVQDYRMDKGEEAQRRINHLKEMPTTIKSDIDNFDANPQKWWEDLSKYFDEMTKYENDQNFFPTGQFESARGYRDTSDRFISAASTMFNGVGTAQPVGGTGAGGGDVVIYNCENDATGSNFQLVPNDLDFQDLFKNLAELGHGLKMIIKLMALMLLGQMIIRLFFINLYIITAPLGIACWALPGRVGQPVARLWLQGFITTSMVQFLMVIAAIVTQVLLGNVLAFVGGDPQHIIGHLKEETLADMMHIACLWFVIRIPSLLGSAPMNTMSEAGQMMAQAVSTTVAMQVTQFQMVTQTVLTGASAVAAVAR